jgi:hypothetical protein
VIEAWRYIGWFLNAVIGLYLQEQISAIINIDENSPAFTSSSLSALSLNECARLSVEKEKQLKYHDNSAVAHQIVYRKPLYLHLSHKPISGSAVGIGS